MLDGSPPVDGPLDFLRGPAVPNVGGLDRAWRAVVGPAVLVAVGLAAGGAIDVPGGPAGAALLAVGAFVGTVVTHSVLVRKCRVNYLLGVDTSE